MQGTRNGSADAHEILTDLLDRLTGTSDKIGYIDDVMMCNKNALELVKDTEKFLKILKNLKLRLNGYKCILLTKCVIMLNHVITPNYMKPGNTYIKKTQNLRILQDAASLMFSLNYFS